MREYRLGPLQAEVLSLVQAQPDAALGVVQRLREFISPSAVYTCLKSLERRGLVKSCYGEPTPVRGGRRQVIYEAVIQPKR